jgi:hypothetical protein
MGSCGSWDASVSLLSRTSVKKKEANTAEEIQKFIKKHKDNLYITKSLDKIKTGDILVAVNLYDEDGDYVAYYNLKDSFDLVNINAKQFIDEKIYKSIDGFKTNDSSPEDWEFYVEDENIEKKLEFLDLKKISKDIDSWSLDNPNFIEFETGLADCSDYIYCHNDNSSISDFKVTQKFIDSLNVGDVIRLYGNGDGEHC